ncbi:hypothetical protein ATCC90586_009646 [Pythium insidiosum]|nr:hypothetical protein ATCC90586_009646 [Pythium insidiosum]
MAEPRHSSSNGSSSGHKRRDTPAVCDAASTPMKKIKLEEEAPPMADPNTIEAVRGRNKALALDLLEKNRRIAFLTQKCEALYRRRVVTDSAFRCMRRQWLQLVNDAQSFTTALGEAPDAPSGSEWQQLMAQFETLGEWRMPLDAVTLELPEWFAAVKKHNDGDDGDDAKDESKKTKTTESESAGADDEDHELAALTEPHEKELESELQTHRRMSTDILKRLVTALSSASTSSATRSSTSAAQILAEKQAAVSEMTELKDTLSAYKHKIRELESDLEAKETERHQVCRDYDRLCEFVERHRISTTDSAKSATCLTANGASDDSAVGENPDRRDEQAKAPSRTGDKRVTLLDAADRPSASSDRERKKLLEDISILVQKLQQERTTVQSLRKEMERFRAADQAWHNEEAQLRGEYDEKVARLTDENTHLSEELSKLRHKATSMEEHVHDKWKKKLDKLQEELLGARAQIDEYTTKNVALRDKLAGYTVFRDQLSDLKSQHEALKRERDNLKSKVERETARTERTQRAADSHELSTLRGTITRLQQQNEEAKRLLSELEGSITASASDQLKLSLQREQHARREVDSLRAELADLTSKLNDSAVKREELEATRDAFKEENDALISEIEALGKEVSSVRHSKKKVLQQLEEKRASLKKTQGQLAKESDAKSHFFDELSAARLQVASLGQVHTQQKATLEAAKQALAAREAEVESLTRYLKQLEADRDVVVGEKLKVERDAEITKHLYSKLEASQKQQLLHDRKRGPCEHCERLQKKEAEFDKAIAASRSAASSTAASSNGLTNVERLELQDLQKQLKCSVCQDRHKGVIIAKCFHMFCKECVESNLKSRNRKCPTCKKMFGQDDVKNPNMAPRGARPNVLKRKRDLAGHGPKGTAANKKLYALADPTLVLGDGDFSFSRGLATHRGGGRNLVATSFDSERTVKSKYSNAAECIQAVVQAGGHVLHDVDATRLHAMPRRLPNGARTPAHFQYIVFNFPHTGQQRVHLNRVLLRDFFESARSRLLQRGEAHVTLKNRPPYSNWQVEDQAKAAGFVLKERRRFEAKHFPGYEHRTTDPQAKAFEAELCTTYVFIVNRSKFPFVPASALDVEEEEEEEEKTDAHDTDAIASPQRDATGESSEVTTSRKKNRKHKRRKTSPAGGSERCAEPDDAAIEEEAATLVTALWRPLHRRTWS